MLTVLVQQLVPGTTIRFEGKILLLEQIIKVTLPKGPPFFKATLKDPVTSEIIERNFKPDQEIEEVKISKRRLEYLYLEGSEHLFLDIDNLEQILVPQEIVKDRANFLKEGIEIRALFYGDTVFSVELPQFLELLVVSVKDQGGGLVGGSKIASLETNAEIEVPMFIEVGDIIKVDTTLNIYIQRV